MSADEGLPGVPTAYLESYPFPAFVFARHAVPARKHSSRPSLLEAATAATGRSKAARSTTPTGRRARAHRVAWSNTRWAEVGRGAALERCVDADDLDDLDAWLDGYGAAPGDGLFELALSHALVRLQLVKAPAAAPAARTPSMPAALDGPAGLLGEAGGDVPKLWIVTCVQLESPHTVAPVSATPDAYAPASAAMMPMLAERAAAAVAEPSDTPDMLGSVPRRRAARHGDRPGLANGSSTPRLQQESEADLRALLEQTDWASTSLGPRDTWPPELECMINLVMDSHTQDALWLGEDVVQIYNSAYSKILVSPNFGMKGFDAWQTIWPGIKPLLDKCMKGESCTFQDDLLLYARGPTGHFLERYHTWSFVPIRGHGGHVLGVHNPTRDTTTAVLARRRHETMRDLSEQTQASRTGQQFFASVASVLAANPKDVPFALCYSAAAVDSDGIGKGGEGRTVLTLEQSVGVPEDHAACPTRIVVPAREAISTAGTDSPAPSVMSGGSGRFLHSSDCHAWPVARALLTRQSVVVDDCSALLSGFPVRQWDALPESAIVVPICSSDGHEPPSGVLILGLNLYSTLDDDYSEWLQAMRVLLSTSLTSVRAAEAEEQRLLDKERMERAKSAWFQGAAHDLRSPLTLVAGPLDDVLAGPLTSSQRAALSLARRNVARILRLVDALLDFSRIEAGKLEGRFVPINLGSFVTDLAELFRPAVERRRVRFTVDVEPRDGVVFVDPTLLETTVTNLLSNALKYTDAGAVTVRVSYSADYADIAVSDTGCGIPDAELDAVTDRYHRATTALTRGTEGTGIGLALAKEIIRLHGGELLIESRIADDIDTAHGSTFTARIPLAARDVVLETIRRETFGAYGKALAEEAMQWSDGQSGRSTESSSSLSSSPATSVGTIMDGLLFEPGDTLLVVDDDYDMRKYIQHIFAPYVNVLEAGGADDALALAREKVPDLILSDVMMRGTGGIELCMAVRRDPATRLVPVVLHSAAVDDETRMAALTSGADDFLAKPFRPRELLARVHLHMQLGKRRQDLETRYAAREQELRALSDYCPSGILRADATGKIIYANAAWRESAGLDDGEHGRDSDALAGDAPDVPEWLNYVGEDARAELAAAWYGIAQGDAAERTLTWTWTNGTAVSARFIRLDKAVPGMTGMLGCLTDITHQIRRLQDAEDRRREAEESRRQQELLIDTTSHEIRTPISAILQCSSLAKANLEELRAALARPGFRPSAKLFADIDDDLEALESIYQCGLTQERIANDILSLGRIQLDMLSFYDLPMDIAKELSKMMSVFKSEATVKDVALRLKIGPTLAQAGVYAIKTDHVRLGQVVTNLLANAMKFVATGKQRRITVSCDVAFRPPDAGTCAVPTDIGAATQDWPSDAPPPDDTPAWLYIGVHDTGPGLGAEELRMLFQRFSQGSTMIHSRYGGSGLGLFICRRITELLDGRIEVQSVLGQGSVFRFFIKTRTAVGGVAPASMPTANDFARLADVRALASDLADPAEAAAAHSPSSLPMSPFSPSANGGVEERTSLPFFAQDAPLHLLVVEDNKINQTVLKRQVGKVGWSCDVADDGQEALVLVYEASTGERALPGGRTRYDVIVMDLEMPVMDGLTAVRHIRAAEADGELDRQVVIALTGNARQEQIDAALAAGMDDVVIKPYRLPDLMAKLRAVGEGRPAAASSTNGATSADGARLAPASL